MNYSCFFSKPPKFPFFSEIATTFAIWTSSFFGAALVDPATLGLVKTTSSSESEAIAGASTSSEEESSEGRFRRDRGLIGAFLKWWVSPTNPWGFPTKNDHFGVFGEYHYLRKHTNYMTPTQTKNLNANKNHNITIDFCIVEWIGNLRTPEGKDAWIICPGEDFLPVF